MRQLRILLISVSLSACSVHNETDRKIDNSHTLPSAQEVKVLPMTLTQGFVIKAPRYGRYKTTVIVKVDGGTPIEWAVSGMALADKLAALGNDEVEVTIDRSDLGNVYAPNMFKHYARVSYAYNLNRNIGTEDNWEISIAEDVVSVTMIEAANDYDALYQSYVQNGMNADAADKKAGTSIAEKYKLDAGWRLPVQNLRTTAWSRKDFKIKADDAGLTSILKIANCLKDKVNYAVKMCE